MPGPVRIRKREDAEDRAAHPLPPPRERYDDEQRKHGHNVNGEFPDAVEERLAWAECIKCEQAQEQAH